MRRNSSLVLPSRFSRERESTGTKKTILLLAMLFFLTGATSIILSAYPQHLAINNNTVINSAVKFLGNNTVALNGHQIQYSSNYVIPVAGRDFIRITGHQVQVSGTNYTEGLRSIPVGWQQNALVLQKIGKYDSSHIAQIVVDSTVINLIPVSENVLNVNAVDISAKEQPNHYNIIFQSGTVFINEQGVMIKLVKENNNTSAYIAGFAHYNRILLRVI